MTGLNELSLTDASTAIRAGSVSSTELVTSCLERIDDVDDVVRAFAFVDRDAHWTGEGSGSPISGIPIGVKDMIDVRGMPTRAGSAALDHARTSASDAWMVKRLRDAGAVPLGKTHTHEFAYGVTTPQTRNPYDALLSAGGSSGGSAAAIAAHECFAALGTDTGGSARIPASLCGVVGFKARRSSLSMEGVLPLAPILDSPGLLAKSVPDLMLMWRALRSQTRSDRQLTVGIVPRELLGPVAPEVWRATERALVGLGPRQAIRLEESAPPAFGDWDDARIPPLLADMALVHSTDFVDLDRELYGPRLREALDRATKLEPATIMLSFRLVRDLSERLMRCFDDCDVLALPTTPITAPAHDQAEALSAALLRLCAPANWCQLAAISMPVHSEGAPVGLQLMGRTEEVVLEVAQRMSDAHLLR